MKVFFVLLVVLSWSCWLLSAPYPGMASSRLTQKKDGLYILPQIFSVHSAGTGWKQQVVSELNRSDVILYSPPMEKMASLKIQYNVLSKKNKVKTYVKKWMREYSDLGLQILGSQYITLNNLPAFMVDLYFAKTDMQVRQVVFYKEDRVVTFTCSEVKNLFKKTVVPCNRIIRTFSWEN